MNLEQAFDIIKSKLGTDQRCAKFLLITEGYFNAMRNGRVKVTKKNEAWIISKAEQLDKSE